MKRHLWQYNVYLMYNDFAHFTHNDAMFTKTSGEADIFSEGKHH